MSEIARGGEPVSEAGRFSFVKREVHDGRGIAGNDFGTELGQIERLKAIGIVVQHVAIWPVRPATQRHFGGSARRERSAAGPLIERLIDFKQQRIGGLLVSQFLPVDHPVEVVDRLVVGRKWQQDTAIEDRAAALVDEFRLEPDRRLVGDDLEVVIGDTPGQGTGSPDPRCPDRNAAAPNDPQSLAGFHRAATGPGETGRNQASSPRNCRHAPACVVRPDRWTAAARRQGPARRSIPRSWHNQPSNRGAPDPPIHPCLCRDTYP